jgi:RNA polymerase sigma factor (sigma-70 family)
MLVGEAPRMTEPGSTTGDGLSQGSDTNQSGWGGSTLWTVVLLAGSQAPGAKEALEQLCRRYWPPVYAYIRRRGHDKCQAEDLTQGVFAHLLAHEGLRDLDARKGRFRSYLLVCLKNYLANEYDRSHTQKRWNGKPVLSLDELLAEERYCGTDPGLSPDALFDRRWALAVLSQALSRLGAQETKAGRGNLFARLHLFLTNEGPDVRYQAIGDELGMSRDAVAMAVKRLRERFREALRTEIAATIARPENVDEELDCLIATLQGRP